MKNRKGIATYYILTLLVGSLVVGLIVYQVYRTTSILPDLEPPPLPFTTSTEVSSSTCQNAQNFGLCAGLDIAYGIGYRETCCNNFGLCCD